MEKFNGWYKGAQVYLVPQGNDYLYNKAYAETGAAANTDIASHDSWVSDGKPQCVFVKVNPCGEKDADNKVKADSISWACGGSASSVSLGESGVVCLCQGLSFSKDEVGYVYADRGGTKDNLLKVFRAWEAESGAEWIDEAVSQQGKPAFAEMLGHITERFLQLDDDMKNAGGDKTTAYIPELADSATLAQVVSAVNKIRNLLDANGYISGTDPNA